MPRLALILPLMLLTACAVEQTVKGQYYLNQDKYEEGASAFLEDIKETPDSPTAHYYAGRFLLAGNNNTQALALLKKASELSPEDDDYRFWLGVAYAANGDKKMEKAMYEKVLAEDPKHLQALTYMAHNQLERGKFKKALTTYSKVLELWPASPSALYNRAYIYNKLGRTPEEKLAWQEYLAWYSSGPLTRRAVANLNRLGEFEYRNHVIGPRTVTLEKIQFEPFSDKIWKGSRPSLDMLGAFLAESPDISMHIVAYQQNNKELAGRRARSIKRYLIEEFEIESRRLTPSWFDVPEDISFGKKTYQEGESITFFTALPKTAHRKTKEGK